MPGLQLFWFEIAIAPLLAATQPSNPSSLTLAMLAAVFGISFQLLIRPGHHLRPRHLGNADAEPQSAEGLVRPRRVA